MISDAFPGELNPFSKKEGSPRINQVLGRVTGINKDSLRNWMKGSLANLLKSANVETIYLDIDDSRVREIGTSLNIAKDEQDHLFDVGRKLITEAKKTQIENVLDGYLLDD